MSRTTGAIDGSMGGGSSRGTGGAAAGPSAAGGAGAYAARKGDRVGSHGGASAAPGAIGAGVALGQGDPMGAAVSLAIGVSGLGGARASGGCSTIKAGSPTVEVEGQPVARAGMDDNDHGTVRLDQGSAKVFVNGRPLVRVGDRSMCTGVVTSGARKTLIGGPPTSSGAGAGGGPIAAQGLLQLASNEVGRQLGERGVLSDVLPSLPPGVVQLAQAGAPVVGAAVGVATGGGEPAAVRGSTAGAALSGGGARVQGVADRIERDFLPGGGQVVRSGSGDLVLQARELNPDGTRNQIQLHHMNQPDAHAHVERIPAGGHGQPVRTGGDNGHIYFRDSGRGGAAGAAVGAIVADDPMITLYRGIQVRNGMPVQPLPNQMGSTDPHDAVRYGINPPGVIGRSAPAGAEELVLMRYQVRQSQLYDPAGGAALAARADGMAQHWTLREAVDVRQLPGYTEMRVPLSEVSGPPRAGNGHREVREVRADALAERLRNAPVPAPAAAPPAQAKPGDHSAAGHSCPGCAGAAPQRASQVNEGAQQELKTSPPGDAPRTVAGPDGRPVPVPPDAPEVYARARNTRSQGEFGFGQQGVYRFDAATGEVRQVLGYGGQAMQQVPAHMRTGIMRQAMGPALWRMLGTPDGVNAGAALRAAGQRTGNALIDGAQLGEEAARMQNGGGPPQAPPPRPNR